MIETTLADLEKIDFSGPDETIFAEGETPLGVYVLRSGSIDVKFSSRSGAVNHPRIAEPGQLLGLSAIVLHHRHEFSAVTRTPCEIGFIGREPFERALKERPDVWIAVLRILSNDVNAAYDDLRLLTGRRNERTA